MPRNLRRLAGAVGVLFATLLTVALAAQIRASRGDDPIPRPLAQAVDTHLAERARTDSQITAAWREANAARARSDTAMARAARLERQAARAGRRADSLAALVASDTTATDSAATWHAAYDARTEERDTLRVTVNGLNASLAYSRTETDVVRAGLVIADSARHHADSLLAAMVSAVARTAPRCTIPGTFGRVGCPTRTQTFVTGAVVGTLLGGGLWYVTSHGGRGSVRLPLVSR